MNQTETEIPLQKDLLKTFEKIKSATHEGIEGVLKFDSGKPGPTLGITIQTHGNEPSGLAALWYFLNKYPLQQLLESGVVFFVVNNIRATEKYFEAKTDEEKRVARFIDINFNRLPEDTMSRVGDPSYEVNRAQKLRKVWESFDVGLDIHSTAQPSKPMIIVVNEFQKDLIEGFPIEIIVSNIDKVQRGRPATAFYGGEKGIPVLGIEAGSHESPESFRTAIACVLCLMQNLEMISRDTSVLLKREYLLYRVIDSLMFPNDSYILDHVSPMFSAISKGDIIANGDSGPIYSPVSGCTIFGPKQIKPDTITEEVLFFTKPPEILLV